jgi:hypothetical protein
VAPAHSLITPNSRRVPDHVARTRATLQHPSVEVVKTELSADGRSHLFVRDLLSEAAAAITRGPGRSLLTALGTVTGLGEFVATTELATTAHAQIGSSFDSLKAEVTVIDAHPDGTNPFPSYTSDILERLNGVNTPASAGRSTKTPSSRCSLPPPSSLLLSPTAACGSSSSSRDATSNSSARSTTRSVGRAPMSSR